MVILVDSTERAARIPTIEIVTQKLGIGNFDHFFASDDVIMAMIQYYCGIIKYVKIRETLWFFFQQGNDKELP